MEPLRRKSGRKGHYTLIPESEYEQPIRQELADIYKYHVDENWHIPTWKERYQYDNAAVDATAVTINGNNYRLIEHEELPFTGYLQMVSKFYQVITNKPDLIRLQNMTVEERLSVREFPHIIVPAQFWGANVEDFVDNMIGLDPTMKAKIAAQFSWWKDENGLLVKKPEVLPEPGQYPVETTPTIEEYNKFSGLLASGEIKTVGINDLFQLKSDSTLKGYIVGLSPLSMIDGELEALIAVSANYDVPWFTIVLRAIEATKWMEPSA